MRLALLVLLLGTQPLANAEHEEDHRYIVRGYVLTEDKVPSPRSEVLIRANGSGARGMTDDRGYYSLRLHLHNADLGRKLTISTAQGEGTVRATFDPSDRSTRRIHHVNFVGGKMIEGEIDAGGKVPNWVYYLLGATVVLILVFLPRGSIKRMRKRVQAAGGTSTKTSKSPKPRSKKKKRRR